MTPEHAQELAWELTGNHPAAASLLVEAFHGATRDRRRRSWLAYLALDLDHEIPDRWPDTFEDRRAAWRGSALEGPANALADLLLVSFFCTDRATRMRAANLLASVCRKAAEISLAADESAA